jgi:protein ImuB
VIRWMSVRLPGLPIERLMQMLPDASHRLLALAAREGAREIVKAASRAAASSGVREGLPLAAARAICAGLEVRPHQPEADRALLRRLAVLCLQFTPDVCLDDPLGLFLEVGRTHARFGGEIRLAERVQELLRSLGHAAQIGLASTRPAARALAKSGKNAIQVGPLGDPRPALLGPPIHLIDLSWEVSLACDALGIRAVGDLLKLPRSGVASRFGDDLLYQLDCLVGARDEPVARVLPPPRFLERLDLLDPVEDASCILFAAKRLFDLAEADLLAKDRGVEELKLACDLTNGEQVPIVLRPSRPTRQSRTFLRLLQYRLEREKLPAPATGLHLSFDRTVPLHETQHLLFEEDPGFRESEETLDLKDRLSIRLGEDRVNAAVLVPDHRPEMAFRLIPSRQERIEERIRPSGIRPLEIVSRPEPLIVESDLWGRPIAILTGSLKGELRLVRGPERIESGWWDGNDVQRSYFEVETKSGSHLWLFRDSKTGAFFAHGAFS